jgi:hypothetical protein
MASNVAITKQSTLVTAKDVDPKAVTWANIKEGDRPSMKPGELGQMVNSQCSPFVALMPCNLTQSRSAKSAPNLIQP